MQQVMNVFINGISGVFLGIFVLYVVIRANALLAGRQADKSD